MNIERFLKEHDACREGADFARKYATLAEAWDACERPDWLLWAYKRVVKQLDEKQLRLFACWCVRQVWDQLTDPRSRRAVEVAEAYANGEATQEEIEAARKDAYAAARALTEAASAAASASASAAAYASADASASTITAASGSTAATTITAADAARKAQAVQLKLMLANPFL